VTCVVLAVQDPETGKSIELDLGDDFETVFNKVFPAQPPSSQLQHQANMRHTLSDGRSVALPPMNIALIMEGERDG
jgi:hypothetical protein